MQRQQAFELSALYLIYPVVDSASAHHCYDSRTRYGNGEYMLTNTAISDTCQWYLDEHTEAQDPHVSPLFLQDVSHLPPTSVLLAGHDPLYDEGLLLAKKLKGAGVLQRLGTYESTIHAFLSFGVLPVSQEARSALARQVNLDLHGGE